MNKIKVINKFRHEIDFNEEFIMKNSGNALITKDYTAELGFFYYLDFFKSSKKGKKTKVVSIGSAFKKNHLKLIAKSLIAENKK